MTWLKVGRSHALIIGSLPLPLCIEGPTLALVIAVDGVGVGVANRPLMMEK